MLMCFPCLVLQENDTLNSAYEFSVEGLDDQKEYQFNVGTLHGLSCYKGLISGRFHLKYFQRCICITKTCHFVITLGDSNGVNLESSGTATWLQSITYFYCNSTSPCCRKFIR